MSWGQTINEKKGKRALLGIYEEFIERGVTVTFVPLEEKKSNGMIFFYCMRKYLASDGGVKKHDILELIAQSV